jgi:ABC-type transport system involved in cytochrome c biogenesis permease subunit
MAKSQIMPSIQLYAMIFLTAIPLIVDLSRSWFVPFLVIYAGVGAAVAIGAEMDAIETRNKKRALEAEKKTDVAMFSGVRLQK